MKSNRWEIGLLVAALSSLGIGVGMTVQTGPDSPPAPAPAVSLSQAPPSIDREALAARLAEAAREREAAKKAREAAWAKIQPHLADAEEAADGAVKKHCDRLSEFFAERKKRARPFAERALSFGSKWAFFKSKLPFTDGEAHRKYLRERFEQIVFSSAELGEALQSAVKGCVAELQGIENELLVKVRADLNDDALGAMRDDVRFSSEAALREEYARAVEKAAKTFAKDLPVWAGREAATWVGADLAAPIIRSLGVSLISRLGLSGGILGSGVASGAITLGGGVVAGLVIDAMLDRLLRALGYDPEADMEQQVIEAVQYCQDLILDGGKWADFGRFIRNNPGGVLNMDALAGRPSAPVQTSPAPVGQEKKYEKRGLYDCLFSLTSERAKLRNEAIKTLVLEGGGR